MSHHTPTCPGKQPFRNLLPLCLATTLAACNPGGPKHLTQAQLLLGTRVELNLVGPQRDRLETAAAAAFREMSRLSALLDPANPASPVYAINQAAGLQPVTIPPELLEILERAQALARRTDGAFDVTIGALQGWNFDRRHPRMPTDAELAVQRPLVNYRALRLDPRARTAFLERRGMRLDLGHVARVEIMQAGLRVLREQGIGVAMINADGDVAALGSAPGEPWRIGIRDPRAPQELLGVIPLERGAVLSANDTERFFKKDGQRYHHILDPRTGQPTRAARGVTLVAEDPSVLHGLPASIMALGLPAGRALIERTPGLEGLIVDRDGTLWISEGLKPRLRLGRPLPGG